MTIYYDNRPVNYRAKQIREEVGQIVLQDAALKSIRDTAAAFTEIDCSLSFRIMDHDLSDDFTFKVFFMDEDYNALARGMPGGRWLIMPSYQGWALRQIVKARRRP